MDVHLTPYHPFRDVNWRYQKSRNCLLKNGRPTSHDGKDLWKDQFRFFQKLVRCQNDYDRSRLMHESPAHYFAYGLYCDSESGLRAVVEARLLAGETFGSISARLGLTGSVIETFAQCYFDVLSRLSHVDFIRSHVLNRSRQGAGEGAERELALKRIAYIAGPEALNRVLRTPGREADSQTHESTIGELVDRIEDALLDKVLNVIGRMENTDERTARTLIQLYAQLQAVQRGKADSSPGEENYIRNVEAMMKAIPFGLATKGLPKRFDKWKDSAMELRAHEMLEIDLGGEGPDKKDMRLKLLPAGVEKSGDAQGPKPTQRKRQDGDATS